MRKINHRSTGITGIMVLVATIAVLAVAGCGLSPGYGDHETKIIVRLSGKYAAEEEAYVSIDGGGVTVVNSENQTSLAWAAVEPGQHSVFATAKSVTGSWSASVNVEEGQESSVNLVCDDGTVVVKPDILWAGTYTEFVVYLRDAKGQNFGPIVVGPGLTGSLAMRPSNGIEVRVVSQNDVTLLTTTINLFYGQAHTITF